MFSCLSNFVYACSFSDDDDEDKVVWNVECHYTQAYIEGRVINLGDCVYVKVNATISYKNVLKMDFFSSYVQHYLPIRLNHYYFDAIHTMLHYD